LAEKGDRPGAKVIIERAAELAPDHEVTRLMRLELALFGPDPDEARRILADPRAHPQTVGDEATLVLRRYLDSPGDPDLPRQLRDEALGQRVSEDWAIMALARLGRIDEAFEVLRSPRLAETLAFKG